MASLILIFSSLFPFFPLENEQKGVTLEENLDEKMINTLTYYALIASFQVDLSVDEFNLLIENQTE